MSHPYIEVLVAYDIEENKLRRKVHNLLRDYSLRPIQFSVFWGYLSPAEERAVQRALKEQLDSESDKALVLRVRLSKQIPTGSVGYCAQDFETLKNYELL